MRMPVDGIPFAEASIGKKPNTPETGEPTSTGGSGGWSQGHALDVITDAYIRHANNPEYQTYFV